jgi:hypothetical protein
MHLAQGTHAQVAEHGVRVLCAKLDYTCVQAGRHTVALVHAASVEERHITHARFVAPSRCCGPYADVLPSN